MHPRRILSGDKKECRDLRRFFLGLFQFTDHAFTELPGREFQNSQKILFGHSRDVPGGNRPQPKLERLETEQIVGRCLFFDLESSRLSQASEVRIFHFDLIVPYNPKTGCSCDNFCQNPEMSKTKKTEKRTTGFALPFGKRIGNDQVLQFGDGAGLAMAVFRFVLEDVIGAVRREVFTFVNHLFIYIVIKPDIDPESHAVGFHFRTARVVFGFVRIAQKGQFKIRIGILVHQPDPARVFAEKVHDAVAERVPENRVKSLVIDFVYLHSSNVARKRARRKTVTARKTKCQSKCQKERF